MMSVVDANAGDDLDYRFSLANERTFLAWIRTALALIAAGLVAAKALNFDHELARWIVAAPPVAVGAVLAVGASVRWRQYEVAMRSGHPLPIGRGVRLLGIGLALYAVVALVAVALD